MYKDCFFQPNPANWRKKIIKELAACCRIQVQHLNQELSRLYEYPLTAQID
jgi:hypothetical protein